MASRGRNLAWLRSAAFTFTTTRARPPPLPTSVLRPIHTAPTRLHPLPYSALRRSFSHSTPRTQQRDPRHKGPEYDYDASLGDPWFHHRLRTAKPLFGCAPRKGRLIRSTRTRHVIFAAFAAAVVFYYANQEVVPVSGRQRFNCYSEKKVREMSEMQYQRLLYMMDRRGTRFLPGWDARVRMVQRVMDRLIPVVSGGLFESEGEDAEWEVHVIDNDNLRTANAFVLHGGKVFVYSSMLMLATTDDQLACVLSHEIAHNMAKHYSERLSQSVGERLFLGSTLMLLAASPFSFIVGYIFGGGLLDLLFSLPMNRIQESEADYIGLMIMAEACYDPRAALSFWKRLNQLRQHLDMEPPAFISTHPSDQQRTKQFNDWMPQAMEKMKTSDCRGTQGFAEMFKRAMARGDVLSSGM